MVSSAGDCWSVYHLVQLWKHLLWISKKLTVNQRKINLLKVEIKISDCNEKSKECTQCRQRKPSQPADKICESLPTIVISEKPMPMTTANDSEKPPKNYSTTDSTDYIGNFIGQIGRWQLRTIFLIYLTKIPASWFMSCVSFYFSQRKYVNFISYSFLFHIFFL